jgi:hypothetical protein
LRGSDIQTADLFSCVSCEARVPPSHPLRPDCGRGTGSSVPRLRGDVFSDRPPVDPAGKLLRALLLQAYYTIGSEHQLMEQMTITYCLDGSSACRWTH